MRRRYSLRPCPIHHPEKSLRLPKRVAKSPLMASCFWIIHVSLCCLPVDYTSSFENCQREFLNSGGRDHVQDFGSRRRGRQPPRRQKAKRSASSSSGRTSSSKTAPSSGKLSNILSRMPRARIIYFYDMEWALRGSYHSLSDNTDHYLACLLAHPLC